MCVIYGACRVSTRKQSIDRQIRNIKDIYPDAVIVKEAYTGRKINRPVFEALLKKVKSGDTIVFDEVEVKTFFQTPPDIFAFGNDFVFGGGVIFGFEVFNDPVHLAGGFHFGKFGIEIFQELAVFLVYGKGVLLKGQRFGHEFEFRLLHGKDLCRFAVDDDGIKFSGTEGSHGDRGTGEAFWFFDIFGNIEVAGRSVLDADAHGAELGKVLERGVLGDQHQLAGDHIGNGEVDLFFALFGDG